VLSLASSFAAQAADKQAAFLIDANSGQVLYQNAADAPRHPASLAKLMTLYLVFEQLAQGKLATTSKLKMSAHASAAAPSKLDLEPGEEIAVGDAIKALITKSANDVAIALAEHLAGSEERFARLMTDKARQIGMAATTFRNASGLPDEAQLTTARDMATLALRLLDDFPQEYRLFATRTFTYKGETYRNHNTLLFHYQGTDGLKTGYTRASGFNLVASVRRGRKHVIGVVFGGTTAAARNTTMRSLLNIGLHKGSPDKTRKTVLVARLAPSEPKRQALPARPQAAGDERAAPPAPASRGHAAAAPSAQARTQPMRRGAEAGGRDAVPAGTTIEALIERTVRLDPQPELAPAEGSAEASQASLQRSSAPRAGPVLLAKPRLVRGMAPSTLTEQAHRMTEPAFETQAAPVPAGVVAVEIQVGAFQSAGEAQRRLAWVREHAIDVVGERRAVAQPVQRGDKVLYRARFAGFDGISAQSACKQLRALKVDCLLVRPD
jgi:D-alanyl-D-alanine carboxypeptidase